MWSKRGVSLVRSEKGRGVDGEGCGVCSEWSASGSGYVAAEVGVGGLGARAAAA
jgi:hypothetical protein